MDVPAEVWSLIISYLQLNDMIEVSRVCKDFYCLIRKVKFFMRKFSESHKI